MTALITGATGFIGYHLASALLARNEPVCALVRATSDLRRLEALGPGLTYRVDDGSTENLIALLREIQPSVVFHLAATSRSESAGVGSLLESNIAFGTRVLEAMAAVGGGAFVNTGTHWEFSAMGAYQPNGLYAACKRAFRDILAFYTAHRGLRAMTLILFDVYGPGDWRGKLTGHFLRAAGGELVAMTEGEQGLDLIHVHDVVAAYLRVRELLDAADAAGTNETYFVGTDRVYSVREAAKVFETANRVVLRLDWGRLSYPANQIMRPRRAEPSVPGWQPRIALEEGFRGLWTPTA